MSKLIMCKGLPGSGKSTWAKEQEALVPNLCRVNKDDIRKSVKEPWSRKVEQRVIQIRDKMITGALKSGFNVISDDTNLAPKHERRLQNLAYYCGAMFEVNDSFLKVPLAECVRRDSLRGESERVGEKVIVDMYNQFLRPKQTPSEPIQVGETAPLKPYVEDEGLPAAVLCDLDGTLAIHNGRSPYDFEKCDTDVVNKSVRSCLWAVANAGAQVIYVSGRDDSVQDKTQRWLDDNECPQGPLYMRITGDKRKDAIAKREIFDVNINGHWHVLFVLDDRDQVVKMWRDAGLQCFQVNYGAF